MCFDQDESESKKYDKYRAAVPRVLDELAVFTGFCN